MRIDSEIGYFLDESAASLNLDIAVADVLVDLKIAGWLEFWMTAGLVLARIPVLLCLRAMTMMKTESVLCFVVVVAGFV